MLLIIGVSVVLTSAFANKRILLFASKLKMINSNMLRNDQLLETINQIHLTKKTVVLVVQPQLLRRSLSPRNIRCSIKILVQFIILLIVGVSVVLTSTLSLIKNGFVATIKTKRTMIPKSQQSPA
jgi:hypothetical protein